MTLQEKLLQKKEQIEGNMPPPLLKIMRRATKDLAESEIPSKVLKVSEKAPDFTLENQKGEKVELQSLLQKSSVAITFYRGFWCPYCNIDLEHVNQKKKEVEEAGASLLVISPELPKYSQKVIKTQGLDFDILHDKGNQLAEKFGLKFFLPEDLKKVYAQSFGINLKQYHGDNEWALPMPARFLVDSEGVIKFSEFNADYTQRPSLDDLIEVAKML